jgi:protein-L-isoaspartate(D-aspartate) O-methyltransferase
MPSQPAQPDRTPEREQMVAEQLAARGIRSEPVLAALRRIPRELFTPPAQRGSAYADGALPIDCHQTISQPYMVARMTELLELRPDQPVLEIGTGSGYQTAVLACLARHVYTIEWHEKLLTAAAGLLGSLSLNNVTYRCTDGSVGWPERGPFYAIIVTAGAPEVPRSLCEQLADGGRLVVPVGPTADQTLVRVRKSGGELMHEDQMKCRFVKLLGEAGWRE